MTRPDGRSADEMRPVKLERGYLKHPEGSVRVECGDTVLVCAISVENGVPPFARGSGQGWLTAEYGMLPRSTHTRSPREATRGRQGGRTMEIQRLIGRSLRSVVNLSCLGERTLWIDCDVLQADGGTRTAAITGSFVALCDALAGMRSRREIPYFPVRDFLAAISVGIVDGENVLDLAYAEDSRAAVDMNVVATGGGAFVEVQGTAEGDPFPRATLDALLDLAWSGIQNLITIQREALENIASLVGEAPPAAVLGRRTQGAPS